MDEKKKQMLRTLAGVKGWNINVQLVCPHCNTRGRVIYRVVDVKQGVSGGKATGAILTAGLSLFATGLSRKVKANEFKCKNCNITWTS